MSITKTVLNLDSTEVTIPVASYAHADKTKFANGVTSEVANGGSETTYRRLEGDDQHPGAFRAGVYPNPKANGGFGKVNTSGRYNTYMEILDTVTGIAQYYPCSAVVALEFPGNAPIPTVEGARLLLQNCVSWFLPLVAGAFGDDALSTLRFSVTEELNEIVDDPTA